MGVTRLQRPYGHRGKSATGVAFRGGHVSAPTIFTKLSQMPTRAPRGTGRRPKSGTLLRLGDRNENSARLGRGSGPGRFCHGRSRRRRQDSAPQKAGRVVRGNPGTAAGSAGSEDPGAVVGEPPQRPGSEPAADPATDPGGPDRGPDGADAGRRPPRRRLRPRRRRPRTTPPRSRQSPVEGRKDCQGVTRAAGGTMAGGATPTSVPRCSPTSAISTTITLRALPVRPAPALISSACTSAVDHRFNDIYSFNVTTDFTYDNNSTVPTACIRLPARPM